MNKTLDLGAAKAAVDEIEGNQSNNCIKWVKEYGYYMAEKLGCFIKEKEAAKDRMRELVETLREEGYSDADILAVSPLFKEVLDTCKSLCRTKEEEFAVAVDNYVQA